MELDVLVLFTSPLLEEFRLSLVKLFDGILSRWSSVRRGNRGVDVLTEVVIVPRVLRGER